MVKWLTGFFTLVRDDVKFRLHDRESRRVEIEDTAQTFTTANLEHRLQEARQRLAAELERRFDAPMRANRSSLAALLAKDAALAADEATLLRDHTGELKAAYAELEELKSNMAAAKRVVEDAYDDLKSAKGRISSWHSRSKSALPIYGKRGKPIPNHSFFFFSHSDLDSAKRDADRASARIDDAKRARDRVFVDVRRCGDVIGELKDSRERRRTLLAAGQTRSKILADRAALQPEISRLNGAEGRMQRLRNECVAAGGTAMEIASIQGSILDALARRADRLRAFDTPEARSVRRDSFLNNAAS